MNMFGFEIPVVVLDAITSVLVLAGALLCLIAAIGVLRLSDAPSRLHAATKPQVFGLMLICLAIALDQRSVGGILVGIVLVVPVLVMQFGTAPLSAHMIGRQAYRNGTIDERSLVVNDLAIAGEKPGEVNPPGV